MKDKIKIAIIGFGRMGITHFSIINSHPLVKLVAVVDTSSTITSLLKKYTGTKSYDNYETLFKNEDLDALIIVLRPNYTFLLLKWQQNTVYMFFWRNPALLKKKSKRTL